MEIIIEEEKKFQQGNPDYSALMTDEQRRRGEYYRDEYFNRRAEVDSKYKSDWDYYQEMYQCKRSRPEGVDDDYPCNFIPLLTPCVEGQIASMSESTMEFKHVSNIPGKEQHMLKLDAASEYYRKKSNFKLHMKDFSRYYDLLGNGWVTVSWEKALETRKTSPSGFPRLVVPSILSVLVDGRIKDYKDLQYADYIIREIGFQSIAWARTEYGDDYADALLAGFNRKEGESQEDSVDDSETFMLLHVWTRSNPKKNLQLIEMDANGLILRESDPDKPYYKYVNNEYPFGFARMMPNLGEFYGFGDGAILKPMQEAVNNLTDELELSARFNAQARTYVDPAAKMGDGQMTSNPEDIVFAKNPHQNILVVPGVGISNVIPQTIEFMLREAQRSTRFHDIMTGSQTGTSATATQIMTQTSQGSVGIKDKKSDIAEVMGWADMYALKLCIEFWDTPFWATIRDEKSVIIDSKSLVTSEVTVPMSMDTINKNIELAKKGIVPPKLPYYETVPSEDGELIDVDFTTRVIIGEAIPKGATDWYNIWLGLSQMQVMEKDGSVRPLVSADKIREAFETILGVSLKTLDEKTGESSGESMMAGVMNQLNPIGKGGTVQVPTANNLQQTVAQMPNADSRKVNI